MRMLCWPLRSRLSASRRLLGGMALFGLAVLMPSLMLFAQTEAPLSAPTATLEKLIEAGRLAQAREELAKLHAKILFS